MSENQIVIYQPNETVRLDVRLESDTVWLTQAQLCELFGVVKSNVSYHLKNIYGTRELDYGATVQKIRTVRTEAGRAVSRDIEYFNLDVIISLGYRINSKLGIQFRQWATRVLKEYMLRGYVVNQRLNQLEDKVDRRLAKVERSWLEVFRVHETGLCRNPTTESEGVKWLILCCGYNFPVDFACQTMLNYFCFDKQENRNDGNT